MGRVASIERCPFEFPRISILEGCASPYCPTDWVQGYDAGSAHSQCERASSGEWKDAILGDAVSRMYEMCSQTRPATDSEGTQNRRPGSVGMGGRRVLESVGGIDRNTQPPTKIDPQLSRQSGTFHRQTVCVRGSMRSSFGVSVSIAPDGW